MDLREQIIVNRCGMKTLCRYILAVLVLSAMFITAGCGMKDKEETQTLPYYNGPDFTPLLVEEGDEVPDSIHPAQGKTPL